MKHIIPITTLVLGLGGGYFLGHHKQSTAATNTSGSPAAVNSSSKSDRGDSESDFSSNSSKGVSSSGAGKSRSTTNPVVGKIEDMLEFYKGLDRNELEAEALKLEDMPFSDRMVAASLLFARWGELDPFEALAFSDKIGFAGQFVRPTILQSWASADPKNAAKYFDQNPDQFKSTGGGWMGRGGDNNAAAAIAGEWAKKDFNAALDWSKTLKGKDAGAATTAIFAEVAKKDPQQAIAKLSLITDEQLRKNATSAIASEYARINAQAAETWALSLGQPEQNTALAKIYGKFSESDPFDAGDKMIGIAKDQQGDALGTIINNMAKKDPVATMNWISTKAGDLVNPDMIRRPMSSLAAVDDAAARQWLGSQQASPVRDMAVLTYIYSSRNVKPSAKLELANTVQNDRQQKHAVDISVVSWLRENPDEAQSYMNGANFDAERIKRLVDWSKGGDSDR